MEAKDIKKVACVGAGVIGYSWALYYSLKKLSVNVYDLTEEKLDLAKKRIHEAYTWDTITQKYLDLFDELLENKN